MPINYRRHIETDHNGHQIWQCLLCTQRFVGNAEVWRFCPLCATEWVGVVPVSDRQRQRVERFHIDCQRTLTDRKPVSRWVIERREWVHWQGQEPTTKGWWVYWRLPERHTATDALSELRRYKALADAQEADYEPLNPDLRMWEEYRLRLVSEPFGTF